MWPPQCLFSCGSTLWGVFDKWTVTFRGLFCTWQAQDSCKIKPFLRFLYKDSETWVNPWLVALTDGVMGVMVTIGVVPDRPGLQHELHIIVPFLFRFPSVLLLPDAINFFYLDAQTHTKNHKKKLGNLNTSSTHTWMAKPSDSYVMPVTSAATINVTLTCLQPACVLFISSMPFICQAKSHTCSPQWHCQQMNNLKTCRVYRLMADSH